MEDYLLHWWNGDLEATYHFFSLSISQLNRLSRVGMYGLGLLALFDLIKYVTAMNSLKKISRITVGVITFAQVVTSPFVLLAGVFWTLVGSLTGKLSPNKAAVFPLFYVASEGYEAAESASRRHPVVRGLDWLACRSISERLIKIIGFLFFVVLAFVELLTS